jgi:hypothetical protein
MAAAQRSIRLTHPPDDRGVGVFTITLAGRMHWYTFREIPCEIGGRGFIVHKLGLGDVYCVRVGQPDDCSCECLGYYRHQRCKHVEGLRALVHAGLL